MTKHKKCKHKMQTTRQTKGQQIDNKHDKQ